MNTTSNLHSIAFGNMHHLLKGPRANNSSSKPNLVFSRLNKTLASTKLTSIKYYFVKYGFSRREHTEEFNGNILSYLIYYSHDCKVPDNINITETIIKHLLRQASNDKNALGKLIDFIDKVFNKDSTLILISAHGQGEDLTISDGSMKERNYRVMRIVDEINELFSPDQISGIIFSVCNEDGFTDLRSRIPIVLPLGLHYDFFNGENTNTATNKFLIAM